MDVYTRKLSKLEDKLVCCFKLAADMINGGIREFVEYTDGKAFLKESWRDLVWVSTSRLEFRNAQVDWCPFMCFKSI